MDISKDIVWNRDNYQQLIKFLESLQDVKYKEFNSKIVNTNYPLIGIRMPKLREVAKIISKTDYSKLFDLFQDKYFEEVILEGLIISYVDDFSCFESLLKGYVLKIDSWAISDTFVNSLNIIKSNEEKSLKLVDYLINSDYEFSVRVGYLILLGYYVDSEHIELIFDYIRKNKRNEYYINMVISWLICECYVKVRKETRVFLENSNLSEFVIRKSISKIRDSYRVNKEEKDELRKLKDELLKRALR